MLWIGITGPMGSGKSAVAHLLRQMGFTVLDADQVAHQVISPGSPGEAEVFRTFGPQLKDAKGDLDRRALGRLVFGDPKKLLLLESIVHPRIREFIRGERDRLSKAGAAAVFYDVPLLFEKKMQKEFDHILVVSAPQDLRHQRIKARSNLSDEEIRERDLRQIPAAEKEAGASVVISNGGTLAELSQALTLGLRQLGITSPG